MSTVKMAMNRQVAAILVLNGALLALPAVSAETTRVSVSSSGAQGNDESINVELAGEGQFAAFVSRATNLVPGDVNGFADVFVHDRDTGATILASINSGGAAGNQDSGEPDLSADGRMVVFSSLADNLAPSDANGSTDIYLNNLQAGTTSLVSVSSSGLRANNTSVNPAISALGNVVVFASDASNLVTGDNNGVRDVFHHNLQTGTTMRVSVTTSGFQTNADSGFPVVSVDGQYVAFESLASNLVANDNNGVVDVFVHDTQTGATARVSVSGSGAEGNAGSQMAAISADGRYIAFQSTASNLVSGDNNGVADVFVHDRQAGTTELLSRNDADALANGDSFTPSVSADGMLVAFHSQGTNLVANDGNGVLDVFLRDRVTDVTTRLSVATDATEGNGASQAPSISDNGRFVAFDSIATNLVIDDSNGLADGFVRDTATGVATSVLQSSILPVGRAAEIGAQVTVFATLANGDSAVAEDCTISLLDGSIGSFFFQTTDSSNLPTGSPDTPVDIQGNNFQTFVLSVTPTIALNSVDVAFVFDCANTTPAAIVSGLNTLILSASSTPGPDPFAIAVTQSNDGVVRVPGPTGANAFAAAAINIGVGSNITATIDTGSVDLPLNIFICQTDFLAQCLSPPVTEVTTFLDTNETATYSVFVNAEDDVPADFANNRVFVRYTDDDDVTVGATSVAVTTQ